MTVKKLIVPEGYWHDVKRTIRFSSDMDMEYVRRKHPNIDLANKYDLRWLAMKYNIDDDTNWMEFVCTYL